MTCVPMSNCCALTSPAIRMRSPISSTATSTTCGRSPSGPARAPEDAADGLQDALLAAHRTARDFRSDAKVTSWLHRIVVNACLDRIRRNNARRTVPLPEWDVMSIADTSDDIAAVDLSVSIGRALHALPDGQRQAIVAVDLEGYSIAEAASLLGVAEGTIKSRCARGGRLKLAQVLGHLRTADEA